MKISGSIAFKAPLCTISNISPGPPVGAPLSVRAPLGHIKGRARPLEHRLTQALANSLSRGKAIQHTVDVEYYAPATRTTLILLCSSCS